MSRASLALLALLGVTAFAPAPFPKVDRRAKSGELTLETFQGTWRVISMQITQSSGKHDPYNWNVTHIRVTKDKWAFLANGQDVSRDYSERLVGIDHTRKPAHFNYYTPGQTGTPSGVGLIRRQGNRVEIIYEWGSEESRAKTFDPPPNGHWLMVLER